MKQWHYTESDEIQGPIPQDELSQMLESGKVSPHTLVWTEGQGDWQPASTIEELAPFTKSATLVDHRPETMRKVAKDDFEASGEQLRPWIRNWARGVDFLLFSLFVGFAIGIVNETALDQLNDTLAGIILLLAYTTVEPLMLMTWGTTPGKFLLNIRLRNADGSKLSYSQGLTRSFNVVIKGQGVGIPLLSLVTHIMAYNRLVNQGSTAWDESGNHTVAHREIDGWRACAVILFYIGFFALIVWGAQSDLPTY